ncbi:hypothetical protein CMK11_03460 [Candidatus Poribacteria bacterium]|nr:hypothetical protein [Candidatus Poribacteria bacterium]
MTVSTPRPDVHSLSHQFDAATTGGDSRAGDAIAVWIRELVDACLYLPGPARSYRDDCLQELTFGLYDLLRRWHVDGRLRELRSLSAFVRHYVRWHLPPTKSRLAFRVSSTRTDQYALCEQELGEGVGLREMPLRRAEFGCLQSTDVAGMRDAAADEAHCQMRVAALGRVDRRIVQLAEEGGAGRRHIEMCLVAEFGLSHRQARRAVDGLPARLRA